jgi:hypothetical protein
VEQIIKCAMLKECIQDREGGSKALKKDPGGSLHRTLIKCRTPEIEKMMEASLGIWLKNINKGESTICSYKITVKTPELIFKKAYIITCSTRQSSYDLCRNSSPSSLASMHVSASVLRQTIMGFQ